jgi:hypothetical protein
MEDGSEFASVAIATNSPLHVGTGGFIFVDIVHKVEGDPAGYKSAHWALLACRFMYLG